MIAIQRPLLISIPFGYKRDKPSPCKRVRELKEFKQIHSSEWDKTLSLPDSYSEFQRYRIPKVTIKVSLLPSVYEDIEYIIDKLDLRISPQSFIAEAVKDYLKEQQHILTTPVETCVALDRSKSILGTGHSDNRCIYIKITLLGTIGELLEQICERLGITRQLFIRQAVNHAIANLRGK